MDNRCLGPVTRFENRVWGRVRAVGRRAAPVASWIGRIGRVIGAGYEWLAARWVTGPICLFVSLASLIALRALDTMLKAMHVPGGAPYGMDDLVRLFPGSSDPAKVVDTWDQWVRSTAAATTTLGPHDLASLFFVVDCAAFVPFYTTLLAIVALRLRAATSAGETLRRRMLWVAVALAFLLALADLGENVCQLMLVRGHGSFVWPGRICWLLKWLLLGSVVLIVGAEAIRTAYGNAAWTLDRLRQLVLCRVHVLVALLVALVFFGPATLVDQAADVVRRLADQWGPLVLLFVLLVLLTAVMLVTAATLVANSGRMPRRGQNQYRILWRALVVCALAFLILFLLRHWGAFAGGVGLYVGIGIAAGVCGLSLFVVGATGPLPESAAVDTFVPAFLAVVPMVAVGFGIFSTAVGDLVYRADGKSWLLLGIGLGVAVAGFVSYVGGRMRLARAVEQPDLAETQALAAARFVVYGVVATLAWLGLTLPAILAPWWFARVVDGTVGVLLAFAISLLCIGFVLVLIAEVFEPPAIFQYLRLRRIPVISLIALWFVLASLLDPIGFHAIRLTSGAPPQPAETLSSAFIRWRTTEAAAVAAPHSRKPVPLVFVSAVGGGIRAAYWTALVMQCLVDGCDGQFGATVPPDSVFLASGASGGSLGLVTYVAHQTDPAAATDPSWPDRLDDDYLAPTLTRMLFLDVANSAWRFQRFDDRAAILERSWEQSWGDNGRLDRGLYALYRNHTVWPRLLLNGTSVVDGCRVETSPLRTSSLVRGDSGSALVDGCLSLLRYERSPGGGGVRYVPPEERTWFLGGTKDVGSYLCYSAASDVRLSTAALLSARFPFVSPSARVRCDAADGPSLYVVDGGYWDNTATESISEAVQHLLPSIEKYNRSQDKVCVVPTLVEIDNHYAQPAGPKDAARPKELLVPLGTLGKSRDGRDADSREEAALLFSGGRFAPGQRALVNGAPLERVAHIYPHAHPGIEAPLGWTLSEFARRDLVEQLRTNVDELARVRAWFGPGVSCDVSP